MYSVKSGRNSEYGTPPPVRKHSATAERRFASIASAWLLAARLRLDVPVRQTACSAGRAYVPRIASNSMMPPVTIAPSHSRT
jgi:hypothetical protein